MKTYEELIDWSISTSATQSIHMCGKVLHIKCNHDMYIWIHGKFNVKSTYLLKKLLDKELIPHTVWKLWKLWKFTLTLFRQKFRERNGFNKEIAK